MVQVHRGIQYLARPGIRPRGSHGVRHRRRGISYTGILQVIGIKRRLIHWKLLRDNRVSESYFFKRLLPFLHPGTDILFPAFRESVIHVEHDRLLRFHQSPLPESNLVCRFQPPAIRVKPWLYALVIVTESGFITVKYPDPRVGKTGTHRLFRQQHETTGQYRRER